MDDKSITLSDGRRLAWCEYGPTDGIPVLLFHGTPGCRLDHDPFDRPTHVRTIVADRPGFGLSDPAPDRTIGSWTSDVAELADALGLDRFRVAGISGGGPYALACAALLPERVIAAGVICGVGPLHVDELRAGMNEQNTAMDELARNAPEMLRDICRTIATEASADIAAFFRAGYDAMVEPDKATLDQPEAEAMLLASALEAFRQGGDAFADDLIIHSSPWDFEPSTITCPVVFVHGTLDRNVPLAHAQYLAQLIPGAVLEVLTDEGHLSVAIHHSVPLVTRLVAAG